MVELWKTDHGVDGHDAKTWCVGQFTTREKALDYLKRRGFTYHASTRRGLTYNTHVTVYEHADEEMRHTMGKISYEIRSVMSVLPVDPE